MSPRYLDKDSPWLLALLALLVALGPLSIDLYLPAMPAMVEAMATDNAAMQLTISTYLTGFALFHLAVGPLADRYGRKPVLLGGLALFAAACIGCALSRSIEELLWFRFLQGVAACVGPTLGRAIVRDIFGPTRAARALSVIAMLMALAPAIAPSMGAALLEVLPWPSLFVFLALYSVLVLLLTHYRLEESLPARQSLHPLQIGRNYAELLRNRPYVQATIASALIYSGMITFISSSAFVFIEMLHVPRYLFGLVFTTTVAGYMAGSALSARLSRVRDSEQIMVSGAWLGTLAMLLMLALSELFGPSILGLLLPMAAYTCALGLVLPHAMATALRHFPNTAGTASALFGFVQMALSATTAAVVARLLDDNPRPVVLTMLVVTVVSLLLLSRLHRQRDTGSAVAGR